MKLSGIITNVTAFGAFCDIGVHQDGLIHVSQLADRFIKDPNEVVKVQQRVEVTVLEVDIPRKRISLSMRKPAPGGAGRSPAGVAASAPKNQPSRFGTTPNAKGQAKSAPPGEGWFSAALDQAKKSR
jgi:protein Tex